MFKHTETKVIEVSFSVKELRLITMGKRGTASLKPLKKAMEVLKRIVRENRFSLLGTNDGYQIIVNGYGFFKEIRTSGDLAKPMIIQPCELFNRIEKLC